MMRLLTYLINISLLFTPLAYAQFPFSSGTSSLGTPSSLNYTTDNINDASSYTGTWEQNNHPQVGALCEADQDLTLFFEFSNNANGDNPSIFPVTGFNVTANIPEFHTAVKLPRYFRIRLTNDSGANTTFVDCRAYYGQGFMTANTPVNQAIASDNDAIVVRDSSDHMLDIARSFVGGQSGIGKFGANPNVAASSTEDIIFQGTINWLTSATTVRIKSGGNTNDTSSGTGAQQVTVEGLDQNWNVATETITTNGASASSATSTTFIRIYRAYVGNVGTYTGANTGDIVIENSGGGTDLVTIEAGSGQTQTSAYTIPAGKTGYLVRMRVGSTASKASDIRFWQRQNSDDVTTPFTGKRLVRPFLGVTGSRNISFNSYPSFPAKTDVWASVTTGSGAAGAVEIAYDIILVDN